MTERQRILHRNFFVQEKIDKLFSPFTFSSVFQQRSQLPRGSGSGVILSLNVRLDVTKRTTAINCTEVTGRPKNGLAKRKGATLGQFC
jgi:hypothetical protein